MVARNTSKRSHDNLQTKVGDNKLKKKKPQQNKLELQLFGKLDSMTMIILATKDDVILISYLNYKFKGYRRRIKDKRDFE